MINALSVEQQKWVRDAGFGNLLNFELVEMPQRLAYKVLETFDERTCMLVLQNGNIEVNEQAVHDVLGLPCRGSKIKIKQDERFDRVKRWRGQFPANEVQSLIKASEVVEKIKQRGDADDLFKMNFLVVMTNVLIRSNTNNFVSQTILFLDDELDNSSKYSWAAYVIQSLLITKKRWMRASSLFFIGKMIFLLVSSTLFVL